jgi:hypothetical protein
MSSTITEGEKHPEAKMAQFRAFHKDQRVACQIIRKLLRILAFLTDPLKTSNNDGREGWINIETIFIQHPYMMMK